MANALNASASQFVRNFGRWSAGAQSAGARMITAEPNVPPSSWRTLCAANRGLRVRGSDQATDEHLAA